jgi:AcrR family transcriptional regulator
VRSLPMMSATRPISGVATETPITVRRPQRADARRNFEALLVAARDAFAANGADTSLEEIAKKAGVGVGTLYRNFPTRQDLIEASAWSPA